MIHKIMRYTIKPYIYLFNNCKSYELLKPGTGFTTIHANANLIYTYNILK